MVASVRGPSKTASSRPVGSPGCCTSREEGKRTLRELTRSINISTDGIDLHLSSELAFQRHKVLRVRMIPQDFKGRRVKRRERPPWISAVPVQLRQQGFSPCNGSFGDRVICASNNGLEALSLFKE